ncbi:hypothetical protein RFI_02276 [Reticulomyxa filosa]|uniref:Uncharacterized protein n=1 Tax=Reticulomyxa filosa TaxID=46433 RepID=X6PAZ6_RETFI|nr:hypothetical protein RFI_02276 [Reticulomyxa filosa]|eukprot:ETO34812.1 hypothetical protein RFI_02276 [Reticulomyxa filosa]
MLNHNAMYDSRLNYYSPQMNHSQPFLLQYPPQPQEQVQMQRNSAVTTYSQTTPAMRPLMRPIQPMVAAENSYQGHMMNSNGVNFENSMLAAPNGGYIHANNNANMVQQIVPTSMNGMNVNMNGNALMVSPPQGIIGANVGHHMNVTEPTATITGVGDNSLQPTVEKSTSNGDNFEYIYNISPEVQLTFQQQRIQTMKIRNRFNDSQGGIGQLCQQITDILNTVLKREREKVKRKKRK